MMIRFFLIFQHSVYLSFALILPCLAGCMNAHATTLNIQADAGYTFDDNVTRTMNGGNKRSDQSANINIGLSYPIPITDHMRAILSGSLGTENFSDNSGLSNVSAKFNGEIQYRNSAEFGTATYGFFANLTAFDYQSRQRDGWMYSAGLSARKTFTDRIRTFAAAAHHERDSSNPVFKNSYDSVLINLDYDIRSVGTFYAGGEFRQGDIVISAPYWNWYSNWYPEYITLDDAFSRTTWSYRARGDTQILKLGFNLILGQSSSMDISFKQIDSTAKYWTQTQQTASLGYTTNLYSIAYLVRF